MTDSIAPWTAAAVAVAYSQNLFQASLHPHEQIDCFSSSLLRNSDVLQGDKTPCLSLKLSHPIYKHAWCSWLS